MGFRSQTCGRPTRKGTACTRTTFAASTWAYDAPACETHLTAEERQKRELTRLGKCTEEAQAAFLSWPVLSREDLHAAFVASGAVGEFDDRAMLKTWHANRCAACGAVGDLVEDHDHVTSYVRGYLCRGCNSHEGLARTLKRSVREYLETTPASLFGVRIVYWSPFTGDAQPERDIPAEVLLAAVDRLRIRQPGSRLGL